VNDSLGHAIGDEVLKIVGTRLRAAIRDSDCIGRYGGDEFLILLDDLRRPEEAVLVARKVLASLAEPCVVAAHRLQVQASVGVAVFPDHADSAETLVERADSAMYRAKREASGGVVVFSPEHTRTPPAEDAAGPRRRGRDKRDIAAPTASATASPDRHADLLEANTNLVMAALSANARESDAVE